MFLSFFLKRKRVKLLIMDMFRPCRSKEGKKVLDEKDVPLYSFKLFSFDINLLTVVIIIVNEKEYLKYMTSFFIVSAYFAIY